MNTVGLWVHTILRSSWCSKPSSSGLNATSFPASSTQPEEKIVYYKPTMCIKCCVFCLKKKNDGKWPHCRALYLGRQVIWGVKCYISKAHKREQYRLLNMSTWHWCRKSPQSGEITENYVVHFVTKKGFDCWHNGRKLTFYCTFLKKKKERNLRYWCKTETGCNAFINWKCLHTFKC